MKSYRPARALMAQIEEILSENKPRFGSSPLDRVIELLSEGRHYSWVGIYLAVSENQQHLLGSSGEAGLHATSAPGARAKMLVAMKIAWREVGVLAAESDREYPFGSEDRVLLEKVADRLARFLATDGKYLVREAREKARANPSVPSRRPQSASGNKLSAAAVGEK